MKSNQQDTIMKNKPMTVGRLIELLHTCGDFDDEIIIDLGELSEGLRSSGYNLFPVQALSFISAEDNDYHQGHVSLEIAPEGDLDVGWKPLDFSDEAAQNASSVGGKYYDSWLSGFYERQEEALS